MYRKRFGAYANRFSGIGRLTILGFVIMSVCFGGPAKAEDQYSPKGFVSDQYNETAEFNGKEPGAVVTLRQALSLALMRNPELKAFSIEVRALEARELQAGLLPNPEVNIEGEDFGGSGDFRGDNVLQTTIQLSQLIQLAGKRSKRRQLASVEKD
jgi:outer membrane protein TolC